MSARHYARERDRQDAERSLSARSFARIIELFDTVAEAGNKYPKITLRHPSGSIVLLKRTGKKSAAGVGCVNVTDDGRYPNARWYGRIGRDGIFTESHDESAGRVREFVKRFDRDPVAFAKAHGDLHGNCMFCDLDLTNEDSIARGYGPICAAKYGLPKGGEKLDREITPEPQVANVAPAGDECRHCGAPPEVQADPNSECSRRCLPEKQHDLWRV